MSIGMEPWKLLLWALQHKPEAAHRVSSSTVKTRMSAKIFLLGYGVQRWQLRGGKVNDLDRARAQVIHSSMAT